MTQGLSRQVKSRLETIDHGNKQSGSNSNEIRNIAVPLQAPSPFEHQRFSAPPLASLSSFPPPSQFSPAFSESPLFQVNSGNPGQFQLSLDHQTDLTELWSGGGGSGEGADMSEILLQGLGEDSTFQGLDATVSGGYLFGWPDGPVY